MAEILLPVGEVCTLCAEPPVREVEATCSVQASMSACTCECERMSGMQVRVGMVRMDREEEEGTYMGEPSTTDGVAIKLKPPPIHYRLELGAG